MGRLVLFGCVVVCDRKIYVVVAFELDRGKIMADAFRLFADRILREVHKTDPFIKVFTNIIITQNRFITSNE